MDDNDSAMNWSKTTAEVDQTLAALRENEYEILRFRDATAEFVDALLERGLGRVQTANIVHGMALGVMFPED